MNGDSDRDEVRLLEELMQDKEAIFRDEIRLLREEVSLLQSQLQQAQR